MNTSLEERSYQTFIIGLLLREKEAAEKHYEKFWIHNSWSAWLLQEGQGSV